METNAVSTETSAVPTEADAAPTPVTDVPTYVIAGDWVVDENWFLVRHHSDTSKHTGDAHYRRLETRDQQTDLSTAGDETGSDNLTPYDKVLDLCGAGFIARVLYRRAQQHAKSGAGSLPYRLLAVGRWQEGDTTYLTHLVHSGEEPRCPAGRLGYRLIQPLPLEACPAPPDIELRTLDDESPTIRAVRLHQRRKDGWHIVNRVDWEPPPREAVSLNDPPPRDNVEVIVLDDLEKGTVTDDFVQALREAYPDARWFVRAKQPEPTWLHLVPRDMLALFVIGPEVAFMHSPFERWHEQGAITTEAMAVLDRVQADNAVLMSERREIIAKQKLPSGAHGVFWGESKRESSAINQIGWADAVMAGLVYELAKQDSSTDDLIRGRSVIEEALAIADDNDGVSNVPDRASWHGQRPRADYSGRWDAHADTWLQARRDFGLVDVPGQDPELQVWRASSRLRDYIACIPAKLEIVDEVGKHLRAFSRGLNPRSLGILIQADPGTGKTHLARCLAEAFDFELLSCDVSQMIHREEIFDFFDLIATHQARGDGRRVLAFVDEINADLEGAPSYGAFLSPLESNVYTRRGHAFTLRPCVWLFTGTNISPTRPEEKGSDFMSRMTLKENIAYRALAASTPGSQGMAEERRTAAERAARLEQVYFGATMINRYFPDVTLVEREILEDFFRMQPETAPFREIRQVAASLRNVKHGKVRQENLSEKAESSEVLPDNQRSWVKLVFGPGQSALQP